MMLSYLKDFLETTVRLAVVTLFTAVLNVMLFNAVWYAWEMYKSTHIGGQFALMHPALYQLINEVVALTPYWQTSLQLAIAAMACGLGVAAASQVIGLRRLLFNPFSVVLRLLWAVPLAMLAATLTMQHDERLGEYQAHVYLLLPAMLCVLFPAMRAAGSLLPDLTLLLSAFGKRR